MAAPRVDQDPSLLKPVPDLLVGTLNALLLLGSVPLAWWVDGRCCERFDELERLNAAKPSEVPPGKRLDERPPAVLGGLLAMTLLSLLSLVLRFYEFPGLQVRWNENAYAGIVWSLLGLHLLYILIEVIEYAVMALWVWVFGLGQNQAGDVILTSAYWYWTVAVGVVIYAVVYWFPRVA